MPYGVTSAGFERIRLPEIREEVIAALRANLRERGFPDNIETRPDSVFGVLIDTFADREAALWEMAEGVYYAMYPDSASGAQLDRAVSFAGVRRLQAEFSQAYVTFYGSAGTVVPVGTQLRNRVTQTLWETQTPVTIGLGSVSDVTVLPTVAPSTLYRVTINGTNYDYTSAATTSLTAIQAGMVAALAASPVTASSTTSGVRIRATQTPAVSMVLSASLASSALGTSALARTSVRMAEATMPGDINTLVTLVPGVASVTNPLEGTIGRTNETDAELRARYVTGVYRLGAATLPSLAPNIINNVAGIEDIRVFANNGDAPDAAGRLPHSIHVVAEGGLQEAIARAIYTYKAAGIDTNGAIVQTIETAEGGQLIRFDRPTRVYIWVRATITLLPAAEEAFPASGFDDIKLAIYSKGLEQTIGQDVVTQKFYGPIYRTPGVASVALTFASSTNPNFVPTSGNYTAANITIADTAKAVFDLARIEVV